MTAHPAEQQHFPGLDQILDAVAGWITKYRQKLHAQAELAKCGRAEVARIARDLGVSSSELKELAGKGPHATELLGKMLTTLGVDAKRVAAADPAVMRDLQRLCVACDHKARCAHESAAGTAAEHYREFCPNAYTLDAILKQQKH